MQLASLHGSSGVVSNLISKLIKWRLKGNYWHCEIVFEPGDGVAHLMPDGSLEPDANGALWCCSSSGMQRMPAYSTRRAGKIGGVRFLRVILDPGSYTLQPLSADPVVAATWGVANQGARYDWELILGFMAWFVNNQENSVLCTEAAGAMLGVENAWRLDPCSLFYITKAFLTKQASPLK